MAITTFKQLRTHVLQNVFLNVGHFAETVTYRIPNQPDETIVVHAKHSDEVIWEGEHEVRVERLKVLIDPATIACPPARQHAIIRAGEDRAFLFAYDGKSDGVRYRVHFERRIRLTEGI